MSKIAYKAKKKCKQLTDYIPDEEPLAKKKTTPIGGKQQ